MKAKFGTSLICLSMFLLASYSPAQTGASLKTDTWITPSPATQLYIEGLDDRKGVGRIFVPAMTTVSAEPYFAVFRKDELIGEQSMGTSIFLTPGSYTVLLGTGSIEQRIRKDVEVRREETVLVQPTWSALTVEVIDEVRNYRKQDMQIYRADNAESYGLIPAINPELGEQLQTLLLAPGLYKVVSRGEDFNTYVNFTTVFLEPGSYTPLTIVVDSESGKFVGAGILDISSQARQRKDWRLFGAIHGSVLFNSANDATIREIKNNLSLLTQLDNQMVFDQSPHYYLARNLIDIGALQQEGADFVINQDRVQLKNTYVYYILQWLGGYGRFEMTTHLFPTITPPFDSPRDIALVDLDGDTVKVKRGVKSITTQPRFFPLGLKEGIGVNLTPLRRYFARLSLRAGLGYRQVYNNDVYSQDPNSDTRFQRIGNSFPKGFEASLLSNFALRANLTITTEVDILFPFEQSSRNDVDIENFISLGISENVTLEHTLRLKQDPNTDYWIQEQFISLRFSYFLF